MQASRNFLWRFKVLFHQGAFNADILLIVTTPHDTTHVLLLEQYLRLCLDVSTTLGRRLLLNH